MTNLPHIAARLFNTPLLIERVKLDAILSAVGDRLGLGEGGVQVTRAAAASTAPVGFYKPVLPGGVVAIPVFGTLLKRKLGLQAASGLMSYQEIAAEIDAALKDTACRGILLDIDSPGGEVSGCFELARRVREAAAKKPVWAIANDTAFSAAYAIGCAAERIYVTETGGVGSIGVIALHVDQSAKDAQDGLKYTAVYAGARKNDYSPHEPLSDEARAALQAEVDRIYGIFVDHVAAMRGMDSAKVRDTEAALYFGERAVDAGLADGVASFDSVLGEFVDYLRGQTIDKGVNMSETIGVDEAAALVAEARHEALAIVELCSLAGCPDKAAAFIAEGKTEAEVRKALLEMRAAQSGATAIHSTIMPDVKVSALMAAVKKLSE